MVAGIRRSGHHLTAVDTKNGRDWRSSPHRAGLLRVVCAPLVRASTVDLPSTCTDLREAPPPCRLRVTLRGTWRSMAGALYHGTGFVSSILDRGLPFLVANEAVSGRRLPLSFVTLKLRRRRRRLGSKAA
jgi:hypothetical protein